jgi:hypothetical protein
MKQKQITIDGITYNLVPVEETKPALPFHISPKDMTWQESIDYAKDMSMRLLRSEELHVLARDGHLPIKENWAWSSSSVSNFTSDAWFVYLGNGGMESIDKTNTLRAVCVPLDFSLADYLKEQA